MKQIIVLLCALFATLLGAACTWHASVKDFFDEGFSRPRVMSYNVSPAAQSAEPPHTQYVPSEKPIYVELQIANPYGKELEGTLDWYDPDGLLSSSPPTSQLSFTGGYTKTLIGPFTFKKDAEPNPSNPKGRSISCTLSIQETESTLKFTPYRLTLSCNSKPSLEVTVTYNITNDQFRIVTPPSTEHYNSDVKNLECSMAVQAGSDGKVISYSKTLPLTNTDGNYQQVKADVPCLESPPSPPPQGLRTCTAIVYDAAGIPSEPHVLIASNNPEDAFLGKLTLDGAAMLSEFNPETLEYTAVIKNDSITVTVDPAYTEASIDEWKLTDEGGADITVQLTGSGNARTFAAANPSGTFRKLSITVKPKNGENKKEYKINFNAQ